MRGKLMAVQILGLMLLLFAACAPDVSAPADTTIPDANAALNPNVKNLTGAAVSFDGSTIACPGAAFAVGDVVLFSANGGTVAKTVTAVSAAGAAVRDADVEEVFSKLELDNQVEIGDQHLEAGSLPDGVRVSRVAARGLVNTQFTDAGLLFSIQNYSLIDWSKLSAPAAAALQAAGVNLTASGSILLKKPVVSFSYSIWTKKISVSIKLGERIDVAVNGSSGIQKTFIDKDILLGTYVVPISVFGISVASVNFALHLNVGLNGSVTLSASAYQELDVTYGASFTWESGSKPISFSYPSWTDIQNACKYGYTARVSASVDAWAAVLASASLTVFQYNPVTLRGEAGVNAHAEATAGSTYDTPSAGIANDVSVSGNATIYAKAMVDYKLLPWQQTTTKDLFNWSKTFAGSWSALP